MSHIILTNDYYLKTALSVILQQASAERKLCIVDIQSFSSLGVIFRLLKKKDLTEQHRLIFIGGTNVSSRVLEPLVTIYRKSCFIEFRQQLTEGRTHSLEYSLNHISHCRNLDMLSVIERKTLSALHDTNDASLAAEKLCLRSKTIYYYAHNIGAKRNLSSLMQVRQFVRSEFCLETVACHGMSHQNSSGTERIEDHECSSAIGPFQTQEEPV